MLSIVFARRKQMGRRSPRRQTESTKGFAPSDTPVRRTTRWCGFSPLPREISRPCKPTVGRIRSARALVLLLRYSGLRIGDAVGCSVGRLSDGKIRLYTQKTGTHVQCPLPDFVIRELGNIPRMSEQYWFWTGNGKLQTAVTDWQGRLTRSSLMRRLDTATRTVSATHSLWSCCSPAFLLNVFAILLGHQSFKITERHYSPWIRERQEQAEADVRHSWTRDPVALFETKGTPELREKPEAVN